jgi:chromosome segregation ATPase
MPMNVEAEIRDLKRRVSEIEGSFGFLMQQIRGVHKDLLAFQARAEQRFERIEARLDRHDSRLDRIEKGVRGLREDLPGILSNAMRAALRERNGKPRKRT